MKHAVAGLCLVSLVSAAGLASAESTTFTPPANYTGNVWVDITVPSDVRTGCFQVIWGPWIASGCATRNAEGKFELQFQKTKTDQVKFTIVYPDGSALNQVVYQSTDPCPQWAPNGCKLVPLTWRAR